MGAGDFATYASRAVLDDADELQALAETKRDDAAAYAVACEADPSAVGKVRALERLGWRVLADRHDPVDPDRDVDFLLVGPGGVVLVDLKNWSALQLRDGSLYSGDKCRDGALGSLLDFTQRVEEVLSDEGLSSRAIWTAVVLGGRRLSSLVGRVALIGEANLAEWATRLGRRLGAADVDRIAGILAKAFPTYADDADLTPRAHLVVPRRQKSRVPRQQTTEIDVDKLAESLAVAERAAPFARWMSFLHPDQLRVVRADANGPARLRGPVGTGKTVVAVHRALHLAERTTDPILFVTYVRMLPTVMAGHCARMAPHLQSRVEFTSLHQLAGRILREAGRQVKLDSRRAETCFAQAWVTRRRPDVLAKVEDRPSYWREELDHVIKGRAITDFGEYADLHRYGRGTPLQYEHRQAVWDLYTDYRSRLAAAGVQDSNDLLIEARDLVRSGSVDLTVGGVIVDEVQDLTLVGLELLQAVAGEGRNRLLIVGDGQQSIYPGGYRLAEAGIAVTGRSTVLRTNYRNAAEILDVASKVVADDSYEDVETGRSADGFEAPRVTRQGGSVVQEHAAEQADIDDLLIAQIEHLRRTHDVKLSDMAVLVHRPRDVDHYGAVLRQAGVRFIWLDTYSATSPEGRLKLGTVKQAKGLEFPYVLLPGLPEAGEPQVPGESDDAYRERLARLHRERYVAMTRARDGLWLGFVERPASTTVPAQALAHQRVPTAREQVEGV